MNNALEDLEAIHSNNGIKLLAVAGTSLLGSPVEQSPEKARNASPISYVSAENPPVLLLQGGKDELVPVAQSERLHAALDRAGVKNQFVLIQAAGHGGPLFSTPEIESKVLAFLQSSLKDPSAASEASQGNREGLRACRIMPVGDSITEGGTNFVIDTFRLGNPNVAIFLAQVIPSGKLPKCAYIPELNEELSKLASRLNTPRQPVIIVNLADGFDWRTDAIEDKVHPNGRGAEKIASRWFEALVKEGCLVKRKALE